jgi:hypothetical protein
MQFGEQFRCHECPEFRGHDRAERKFLLVAVIHIVRKFGAGNSKRLAEHKESWRNRPRHQWSRYDGLGTTGLGSLPTQSGSALQTGTSASAATRAETTCSGDTGTPPASTTTATAKSLSGGVPDPAQRLGSAAVDAAQRLGGTARVPVTPVPCTTTSTIP